MHPWDASAGCCWSRKRADVCCPIRVPPGCARAVRCSRARRRYTTACTHSRVGRARRRPNTAGGATVRRPRVRASARRCTRLPARSPGRAARPAESPRGPRAGQSADPRTARARRDGRSTARRSCCRCADTGWRARKAPVGRKPVEPLLGERQQVLGRPALRTAGPVGQSCSARRVGRGSCPHALGNRLHDVVQILPATLCCHCRSTCISPLATAAMARSAFASSASMPREPCSRIQGLSDVEPGRAAIRRKPADRTAHTGRPATATSRTPALRRSSLGRSISPISLWLVRYRWFACPPLPLLYMRITGTRLAEHAPIASGTSARNTSPSKIHSGLFFTSVAFVGEDREEVRVRTHARLAEEPACRAFRACFPADRP